MNKIEKIQKYMKLEKIHHTNIDKCHILILETLLNEPDKWFSHSYFKDYLTKFQFSTATIALSEGIKNSIGKVRIHAKNLFWVDKRKSVFDKRMNEIKISKKGLNDLKSLIEEEGVRRGRETAEYLKSLGYMRGKKDKRVV